MKTGWPLSEIRALSIHEYRFFLEEILELSSRD
jgi:hypothetical protein